MSEQLDIQRLAALVKAKRGKKGLRETAKEIGGVSASTLSRIEQGKMPDLDTYVRLCEWLGIPAGRFLEKQDLDQTQKTSDIFDAPGLTTPEIIHAHLRADKELDPETAEALAEMVRAAYNAIVQGKLAHRRE